MTLATLCIQSTAWSVLVEGGGSSQERRWRSGVPALTAPWVCPPEKAQSQRRSAVTQLGGVWEES